MSDVLYPSVKVRLVGTDGNAFSLVGRVSAALRKASVPQEEIRRFQAEAMSGGYDKLLRTITKWVDVA